MCAGGHYFIKSSLKPVFDLMARECVCTAASSYSLYGRALELLEVTRVCESAHLTRGLPAISRARACSLPNTEV